MELRRGNCKYCKEAKLVEVSEEAQQDEIDKKATEECNCTIAKEIREKRNKNRPALLT